MRTRLWFILLAALTVAGQSSGPSLRAQQAELLYVCVQDEAKVAVVDMTARSVVRTIDFQALGFPATAKPHYVVVEPDGSHWYLSLIGANRVVKLDRQNRIVGQYEMETPGMLTLAGSGSLLASRSMRFPMAPPRTSDNARANQRFDIGAKKSSLVAIARPPTRADERSAIDVNAGVL